MDLIKCRTLTLRSSLGYGKYAYYTIDQVLTLDKSYLRWVYYHSSKINFTQDVLELLGIEFEHTIPKPGRSENMYSVFRAHASHEMYKKINKEGDWSDFNQIKKNLKVKRGIDAMKKHVLYEDKKRNSIKIKK